MLSQFNLFYYHLNSLFLYFYRVGYRDKRDTNFISTTLLFYPSVSLFGDFYSQFRNYSAIISILKNQSMTIDRQSDCMAY